MLQTFRAWLARPFATDQDALHWFLFMGLLIAIMTIWHMILRNIEG